MWKILQLRVEAPKLNTWGIWKGPKRQKAGFNNEEEGATELRPTDFHENQGFARWLPFLQSCKNYQNLAYFKSIRDAFARKSLPQRSLKFRAQSLKNVSIKTPFNAARLEVIPSQTFFALHRKSTLPKLHRLGKSAGERLMPPDARRWMQQRITQTKLLFAPRELHFAVFQGCRV